MTDLKQEVLVSSRQLERLFLEYVGVAPKNFASMARYQYLWNECIYNKRFNITDGAYQYGYSDQSHLCRDFKKYHSMSIREELLKTVNCSIIYSSWVGVGEAERASAHMKL